MAMRFDEHPELVGIEVGEDFASAIAKVADGVDALFAAGFVPPDARSARWYVLAIERQSRRLDAMRTEAVSAIDRAGHHHRDGHRSAKVMVRHVGSLSGGTALRMDRSARALREMSVLRAAFQAGEVSADQVGVLAQESRTHGSGSTSSRWISSSPTGRVIRRWTSRTSRS